MKATFTWGLNEYPFPDVLAQLGRPLSPQEREELWWAEDAYRHGHAGGLCGRLRRCPDLQKAVSSSLSTGYHRFTWAQDWLAGKVGLPQWPLNNWEPMMIAYRLAWVRHILASSTEAEKTYEPISFHP